jgi:L-2-hydroxyglutarate oxidase LhgO
MSAPVERVDALVVGAGVVGLAVARALALAGREVMVLEGEGAIGTGTSSRNSEVIHAGIYYPAGSLKARLCVQGKAMLYAYCAERGVAHKRCGKLIVATTPSQLAALPAIVERARANGVDDLRQLTGEEARAMEPALQCLGAVYSPSTGIVDSHALMLALQGDLENAGGLVACRSPVRSLMVRDDGIEVVSDDGLRLLAQTVVNAAGLAACDLAAATEGLDPRHVPRAWYAKGSYFSRAGRSPFQCLIYPAPEPDKHLAGLGVHLTVDLGGQAKFGPDVQWTDNPLDLQVDPARGDAFYAEVRRYWPALPDGALLPDYAGIRPKISGPNEPAADFVVQGPAVHGIPGLVNLFGIESPGLTSALAIGEVVADLV